MPRRDIRSRALRRRTAGTKHGGGYQCKDCRREFSVRADAPMGESAVPRRKRLFALHLWNVSLKDVSSVKLHRDIRVTQKTARFMLHRPRENFPTSLGRPVPQERREGRRALAGLVEADEMFIGGKGQHAENGRPHINRKQAVAGAKDRATGQVRAKVILNRRSEHMAPFVEAGGRMRQSARTSRNPISASAWLRETAWPSSGERVREAEHVSGLECFRAAVKRVHMGTFYRMSRKRLQRCIDEFAGRQNNREQGTIDRMRGIVQGLLYRRFRQFRAPA